MDAQPSWNVPETPKKGRAATSVRPQLQMLFALKKRAQRSTRECPTLPRSLRKGGRQPEFLEGVARR